MLEDVKCFLGLDDWALSFCLWICENKQKGKGLEDDRPLEYGHFGGFYARSLRKKKQPSIFCLQKLEVKTTENQHETIRNQIFRWWFFTSESGKSPTSHHPNVIARWPVTRSLARSLSESGWTDLIISPPSDVHADFPTSSIVCSMHLILYKNRKLDKLYGSRK